MSKEIPNLPDNLPEVEQEDWILTKGKSLLFEPKAIESARTKIQDIDRYGVAITNVGRHDLIDTWDAEKQEPRLGKEKPSTLFRILTEGVLGIGGEEKLGITTGLNRSPSKKEWLTAVKQKKAPVHFNIIGRSGTLSSIKKEYPGTAIIFDLSPFQEETPTSQFEKRQQKIIAEGGLRLGTFRANSEDTAWFWDIYFESLKPGDSQIIEILKSGKLDAHAVLDRLVDRTGRPLSNSEYGFILSPRIPPRLFRGIIAYTGFLFERKQLTPKQILFAMKAAYCNRKELMLPIYNEDGILLWPLITENERLGRKVDENFIDKFHSG